jgi:hypothetical protein
MAPQIRASHLLVVMLGCTTLMAAACADDRPLIHRNFGSGDTAAADGAPKTDAPKSGSYDPQSPSNTGPGINPAGFAAVAPIMKAQCSECHHPGSPIDLESGADATTAAKIVATLAAGTMPPAPRTAVSAADRATIKAWHDGATPAAGAGAVAPPSLVVPQLLDAATLATYRAALPKVAWGRLAAILASPSTLFWDKETIPPAYQDTVGDGSSLPFGARLNGTGKSLIVPEGQKLFSADGTTWSFPFGHTAGAYDSTNTFIVNFMSLPAEAGALLPIAYRIETGTVQGLPIKRWNWSFPRGTVVGEVVMIKDGSSLLTSEIRVRERFGESWATDVFRPFPTASVLAATIKAKRPAWQSAPSLKALVEALEDTSTLVPRQVGSPAFANLVSLQGSVDAPLPDVGDDALVRELLTSTTFVGAYGTAWKTNGAARAFGATGPAAGLSVVPNRFELGLIEVREATCTKCHDQGGTFIGSLVDQAILYGDVWGTDRIFSFHPFEPSSIDASGNENRTVRSGLTSLVVPYDAATHPSDRYSFYRPAQ